MYVPGVVLVPCLFHLLKIAESATPMIVDGNIQEVTIDEGVAANFVVMTIAATGVTKTYCTLMGPDSGSFSVTPETFNTATVVATNPCSVKIKARPDFQGQHVYTFIVSVFDGDGGSASGDSADVSVTVSVVNKSPLFPSAQYAVCVPDNASEGQVVVTVTGTPVTSGDTVTYVLGDGNMDSVFSVEPTSGVITIAKGKYVSASVLSGYSVVVYATTGIGMVYTGTGTVYIVVGLCSSADSITGSTVILTSAIWSLLLTLWYM